MIYVVIPTYNEKENICDLVKKIFRLNIENLKILVIDDNSPDGTYEALLEIKDDFPLEIIKRPGKMGLGSAYIEGFKYALSQGAEMIVEMDADFSHNPNDLPKLYDAAVNADMSIGSRYCNGVNVVNWPMSRVLLSYFASKYVRFVLRIPVFDTTAGFVCFSRKVLEEIGLDQIKMTGYGFQVEMKYRAFRKKFQIAEVPIIFTDRTQGESKMNGGIIKEAVFGVIDLKLKSLFGKL